MPSIGPTEIILVLVIALLVLGPSKLPELGRSMGRAIREFRNATRNATKELGLEEVADDVKELRDLSRRRVPFDLKKEMGLEDVGEDELGEFPDLTAPPATRDAAASAPVAGPPAAGRAEATGSDASQPSSGRD